MTKQEELIRKLFKQICCPQSFTMWQINKEELDKFIIREFYKLKEKADD